MIIYKWTSPSGKQYIGQSIHSFDEKYKWYQKYARIDKSNRLIFNAIRKYGIENMKFELVEGNANWTKECLNEKEIFYIKFYNTYYKNGQGYNMTIGGDGIDSVSAKKIISEWHENMPADKKASRAKNCSLGQKERYRRSSDSVETRKKKSKSHQRQYIIESPDGTAYNAKDGLKEFAKKHGEELNITYWQLFNAYRKSYKNQVTTKNRKDSNNWKVNRIDK